MGQSLTQIGNLVLKSIRGRELGLTYDNYLAGPKASLEVVQDIQSTVPNTAVLPYGITRILTSGSSQGPVQHTLPGSPYPGVRKTLQMNTTSTGSQQFLAGSGVSILAASDATTKAVINFVGQGGSVTLAALTTAIWAVVEQCSTGAVTYTTST